jgi:hypothetical protein
MKETTEHIDMVKLEIEQRKITKELYQKRADYFNDMADRLTPEMPSWESLQPNS